jgi:hypothetical protein
LVAIASEPLTAAKSTPSVAPMASVRLEARSVACSAAASAEFSSPPT